VDGGLPPLTYEWLKFDGSKATTVVGTGSPFVISNLDFGDAGTYSVRVTDAGVDQELSNEIALTVEPGLPLTGGAGLIGVTMLIGAAGAAVLRRRK
jgi:hypothetical protein